MLNILMPMAGRGSRFRDAGFDLPKPMIPINGKPMVEWAAAPLVRISSNFRFIFVALEEDLGSGLGSVLSRLGEVVALKEMKEGAVQSALAARHLVDSKDPLLLANCDQFIDWELDSWLDFCRHDDGSVLTFTSSNPHHSYVEAEMGRVKRVKEKEVISNQAVAGLYWYKTGALFVKGAEMLVESQERTNGEYYVSPIFNHLISTGATVSHMEIPADRTHMLGTPEELSIFKKKINGGAFGI